MTVEQSPATEHDFKALRESKRLTLSQAAAALHTQPARIFDIEKQRLPLPELTGRYKQWLDAA